MVSWNLGEIKQTDIMYHFSAFCIRVIEEGRIGETNRIGGIDVLSNYNEEVGLSEFE